MQISFLNFLLAYDVQNCALCFNFYYLFYTFNGKTCICNVKRLLSKLFYNMTTKYIHALKILYVCIFLNIMHDIKYALANHKMSINFILYILYK